MKLITGNFLR